MFQMLNDAKIRLFVHFCSLQEEEKCDPLDAFVMNLVIQLKIILDITWVLRNKLVIVNYIM